MIRVTGTKTVNSVDERNSEGIRYIRNAKKVSGFCSVAFFSKRRNDTVTDGQSYLSLPHTSSIWRKLRYDEGIVKQ